VRRLLGKINCWGAVFAADPQVWSGDCVFDGDVATIQGIECLFRNVLGVITSLAGLAFGVMIVIGGFNLIFSGGEKSKIQAARTTLTLAFAGIALIIGAWFILLLIETVTGARVTEFTVPRP